MTENTAFGVLAGLIDYPTAAMHEALDASWAVLLADRHLPRAELGRLATFLSFLRASDPLALQENYLDVFSRGRGVSLYLFEHRREGAAVDATPARELRALYEKHGLYLYQGELPDYLPVFLDFLARQPWKHARAQLADQLPALIEIALHLCDIGSRYSIPLATLVAMAGAPPLELPPETDDDSPPRAMTVELQRPATEWTPTLEVFPGMAGGWDPEHLRLPASRRRC